MPERTLLMVIALPLVSNVRPPAWRLTELTPPVDAKLLKKLALFARAVILPPLALIVAVPLIRWMPIVERFPPLRFRVPFALAEMSAMRMTLAAAEPDWTTRLALSWIVRMPTG